MKREDQDAWLKDKIQSIYSAHKGRYGYRRITIAMNNDLDVLERLGRINHKRVSRLMKLLGLQAVIRRKKYKSYKGEVGKVAPNVLDRDFSTTETTQKIVTDITEFKVKDKKIYLSPIIDLHTREVLSYTYGYSPSVQLVIDMLEKGLPDKNYKGLIIHSDQGFQYQNKRFQTWLEDREIEQSMSRKGNCLDNSLAENFFSQLKAEFYYRSSFKSIKEFTKQLEEYIHYYNHERIITKLKMPPVSYREHLQSSII